KESVPACQSSTQPIDARLLFDEGQKLWHTGRYGAARVTFETLIAVYPESCLVKQAREAIAAEQQIEDQAPVVRSLEFRVKRVHTDEILKRFNEREVGLCVETRYDPRDVEQAKTVLTALLIERGVHNPRVEAAVTPSGRNVAIRFTMR